MCKVDSDRNIMALQASNSEMWVAKRLLYIGPRGKPTMVF